MKRLLLLRHADAVASAHHDHGRPLSPRGQADAAAVGRTIAARGWQPSLAVVSDARRTLETVQWLALQPPPHLQATEALYNAGPAAIAAVVAQAPSTVECQLLVGHNPNIALAARALAVRGPAADLARLAAGYPTAGLAVIRFAVPTWAAVADAPGELEALLWVGDATTGT